MQKVRRGCRPPTEEKHVQASLLPAVQGESGGENAEHDCVRFRLGDTEYQVPRSVALGYIDLYQLVGSIATRITDPQNYINLSEEGLGVPVPRLVQSKPRIKLKRRKAK